MGQLAEEAGPQGGLSGPRQGPKCLLIKSQLGLEPALSLPSPGTLHTPLSEVTSWEAAQGGASREGCGRGTGKRDSGKERQEDIPALTKDSQPSAVGRMSAFLYPTTKGMRSAQSGPPSL